MSVSRFHVLSLFRGLIRAGKKFTDYNFRSYALRRTRQGFRENLQLKGEDLVKEFKFGQEQLKIVERQAALSGLFPEIPSVMKI